MQEVSVMRTAVRSVIVLVAAAVVSGCISRRPCAPSPCEGCVALWVPPHVEKLLCTESVPATTRPARVSDIAPCRDVRTIPVTLPEYGRVQVADERTVLAPVNVPTCVPEMGYAPVTDFVDRLCPTYECRCQTVLRRGVKIAVGIRCERCKPPMPFASVCPTYVEKTVVRPVQTGVRLTSLPCGHHLEQVPVGRKCVPIHVGEQRVPCVTGSHWEEQVVGRRCESVEVDGGTRIQVKGAHVEAREIRPSYLRAVEKECVVPGFWAYVVPDESSPRPPGATVLTRAEYEEYLRLAAPTASTSR